MPQSSHRLPRANLRDLRFARALTVPASCLLPMARLQARKGGAADKYPTTHPTPEGRRGGEKRHFSAVGCVSVNCTFWTWHTPRSKLAVHVRFSVFSSVARVRPRRKVFESSCDFPIG